MRAHPKFRDRTIPKDHILGGYRLRVLGIHDLAEDFVAVMESKEQLLTLGNPGGWPEGLTIEEDLLDLAWHQKEFDLHRSFAWIIADKDTDAYLGCAYVTPKLSADDLDEVWYWFRSSVLDRVDRDGFERAFDAWLSGPDWPELSYEILSPK